MLKSFFLNYINNKLSLVKDPVTFFKTCLKSILPICNGTVPRNGVTVIPLILEYICKTSRSFTFHMICWNFEQLYNIVLELKMRQFYTHTLYALPILHSSTFKTWIKLTISTNLSINLFFRFMAKRWRNLIRKWVLFTNPVLFSCPPLMFWLLAYPTVFSRPLLRNQGRISADKIFTLLSSLYFAQSPLPLLWIILMVSTLSLLFPTSNLYPKIHDKLMIPSLLSSFL